MQATARTEPPRLTHQRGSMVHLDEWVAPDIADERGHLRAGKILEWMDVVGVVAATRHCRMPVVTAAIDGLVLRDPIRVGERVTMSASIAHTSDRSLGVSVSMTHGRPDDSPRAVLDAYMSFVAVDEHGTPQLVPQFVPETPAEVTRFREGSLRRELRRKLATGTMPIPVPAPGQPADRETKLYIHELLKAFPRSLRFPWDRPERPTAQGRDVSYVHTIEPVRGGKLNFHGTLYGGTLMRWIETNASLSARAYLAGEGVRLAGLHGLTFLRPILPNRFVHIRSLVVHTTGDSLTVMVNVQAEDAIAGEHEETLRAFFTYAPVDAGRAPAPVTCAGDDERAVFEEVEHRLAMQRMLGAE
ncbi:MAG: hotdog domain-containing protein [Polyangiaceae bacterium]